MEITDSEEMLSFNALCLDSESSSAHFQLPFTLAHGAHGTNAKSMTT